MAKERTTWKANDKGGRDTYSIGSKMKAAQ